MSWMRQMVLSLSGAGRRQWRGWMALGADGSAKGQWGIAEVICVEVRMKTGAEGERGGPVAQSQSRLGVERRAIV